MSNNQAQDSSKKNDNKGHVNKTQDGKSAEHKTQQQSAKDGAVLKDINGKAKKELK